MQNFLNSFFVHLVFFQFLNFANFDFLFTNLNNHFTRCVVSLSACNATLNRGTFLEGSVCEPCTVDTGESGWQVVEHHNVPITLD